MSATPPLSRRGAKLRATSLIPQYIEAHVERLAAPDQDGPHRYIGLAISENKLVWDLLEPMINRPRNVPARSAGYDDMIGSEQFRKTLATFTSKHVWGRKVDASEVIVLAGAGSILETLFYALGDADEGVLVPTPSYMGYWLDIEMRDDMKIVPVHGRSEDDFVLTVGDLQAAYDAAKIPIRALLLTNPVNPTGRICSDSEILDAVAWARSVGIHVVINEIYALSVHGDKPFTPAGSLIHNIGDDVHFVWAFSKDFAMSGFRCGVMMSGSSEVREAVSAIAYWSVVSGDTQHLLASMLEDDAWVDGYLAGMRSRLAESYTRTTAALSTAGIPFLHADAGLFVLCDFRAYLTEPTWDGEQALWQRFLGEANVNLTPGSACRINEPGFMRICFAQEPANIVEMAVQRIAKVLA